MSIAAGRRVLATFSNEGATLLEKTGARLDTAPLREFFAPALPANHELTDPRVLYDTLSDRFFAVASSCASQTPGQPVDCGRWVVALAVSRTSSPRTLSGDDWFFYSIDGTLESRGPTNSFADYATVALNRDFVLLAFEREPCAPSGGCGSPLTENYGKAWLLQKEPLLTGRGTQPLAYFERIISETTGLLVMKPIAALAYDDSDWLFMVADRDAGDSPLAVGTGPQCGLLIAAVHTRGDQSLVTRSVSIIQDCSANGRAPQAGGEPVDAFNFITSQPVLRDGTLYVAYTVGRRSTQRIVTHLVQLDVSAWPATPTIIQQTVLADPVAAIFYPAVAANANGDVAVEFALSSPSDAISMGFSGRSGRDGAWRPPVITRRSAAAQNWVVRVNKPSEGASSRNRYADFAGASVDPTDGSFWLAGQVVTGNCEWALWVSWIPAAALATNSGAVSVPAGPAVSQAPAISCVQR